MSRWLPLPQQQKRHSPPPPLRSIIGSENVDEHLEDYFALLLRTNSQVCFLCTLAIQGYQLRWDLVNLGHSSFPCWLLN